MKSRTSFFNLTLYKKDITRFAPLWVLYTVGMLLLTLPVVNLNQYFGDMARTLNSTIGPYSAMNLIYGILVAQLLFGELFNGRLCNALHAMPVTREARFGSHLLAGLSFSLVPNLLVSLLLMGYLYDMWYLALLWWLALTLQYLCFFGVAVFAMFCTGNRFAASLVYAIINFGSMAALWFAQVIFVPMMRGVVLGSEGFAKFSPVVKLSRNSDYFLLENVWDTAEQIRFAGFGEDWIYLAVYAAVGVLMLVGSLLLYRRRALESAGDFMAVKALKPIFLVLYTLCAGAFLALFGSIFGDEIYLVFLIVGLIVGFFTGRMLLERTARVFNLKSFLQLGVLVVLMWLALQVVQLDLLGIVRYVPEPETVAKAEVLTYHRGRNEIKTSDPEELVLLQEAHRLAIEEEDCKHSEHRVYYITYHMKDGRTVERVYTLCLQEQAQEKLEVLLSSTKGILGIDGTWEEYVKSVTSIRVDGLVRQPFLNSEDWESFLKCIYEDCENGLMGGKGGAISEYIVTIWNGDESVELQIREYSDSYEWLNTYEKKDLQEYLQEVTSITLGEQQIEKEHHEELLEAIYEDCRDFTLSWEGGYKDKEDVAFVIAIETDDPAEEKVFWIHEYTYNTYEWIKNYNKNPQGV